MNEKLELIRQKCIEANPEIAIPCGCPKGGMYWDGQACEKCGGTEYKSRPIRLADVLLAIPTDGIEWSMKKDRVGLRQSLGFKKEPTDWVHWNLRKDDLNKQSEETIDFLAGLLG
jgi:hypothetical protein